jgi:hypothetical protein
VIVATPSPSVNDAVRLAINAIPVELRALPQWV